MRLKCVKLSGFKSFVDPTTINFPSNLCAVVGPNGCGKSNVIDAVRWVMGESSAKNLRGEHMTDVIFNGSSARKPVGQASVELVFDNQDRKLSGEYANFTEVAIKRRVDREGLSTYSLNGTKCRRRDITDIFLGTGLGARSYSIIEQGMVSRLIESKPEELRVYIEEAAGISKYKERRRETENRIKRTRENLERLADIREELERQLQHLKRQSVAAEKYGEFKQQERETSANLNALRWRSLDVEIRANQERIDSLELDIEAKTSDQQAIDTDIEQHLADNAELTDALGEVQARFYSLGNDIARIEQSIEHHLERVEQLRLDLTDTEDGWTQAREELDIDLRKITQLDAELRSLEPKLEQARQSEQESGTVLQEAEQALQHWQQQWDEFNQRAEEPRQIAEVQQSRIQQLETMVERGNERERKLQRELESLPVLAAPEASVRDDEVTAIEVDLAARQEKLDSLTAQIAEMRAELDGVAERLDRVRNELQTTRGRQASLEALQQAALGQDSPHLQRWLEANGLDQKLRLGESVNIDEAWTLAVEAVLDDALQGLCVDGLESMEAILNEMPQASVTLIDTSSTTVEEENSLQHFPPLSSKIRSEWRIDALVHGIYCADSLSQALAMRQQLRGRESLVTPDGYWVGRNWLKVQNMNAEDSIVARRALIAELFRTGKAREAEVERLLAAKAEFAETLTALEKERLLEQKAIADRSRSLSDLKAERSARLAKQEEAQMRRQRLQQDIQDIGKQVAQEQEHISDARSRLQQALDAMEQDLDKREKLAAARQHARTKLDNLREQARHDKDQAHELALRQQAVEAQLQSTRETMDRMASQVQRSKERIETLNTQIEASNEPLQGMREELETLLQQRLEVEKELAQAKSRVDDNEQAIRKLEKQRNGLQEQLNSLRESLMQVRLQSEGASVKRDALVEQLSEANYELDTVLANLPDELDEESCEQALEKLANRVQRLGPINLAAIDEYQQQSERKVYLDRQNEDLEKALATLQNAIRKIDKETRTRFKETFDKINAGLQSLFPRVFGGGHAYLDMTGEDLLDTGVAIMARPPGKRNSTIHLLSGGEKAMTAIALVFSIFHLNPSPFCMLDEVDAPLDDANVGRYANLVREMAENLQFIFITHNKITMEMAKQLLGVTMHEAGVSRIVAVDIDEAAELAAM